MAKAKKIRKRSIRGEFAPVLRALSKGKGPRGVPFKKGNPIGISTRFVKGAPSANPGGRPKVAKLNEALREGLAADSHKKLPTETNAQVCAARVIDQCKKGNLAAIALAGDRAEGRPNVSIAVNDSGDTFREAIAVMKQRFLQTGPPDESGEDSTDDDEEYQPKLLGQGQEATDV